MATVLQVMANTRQAQAELGALSRGMMMMSATVSGASAVTDTAVRLLAASFIGLGAGAFVAYNATSRFNEALTTVRALGGLTETQMHSLGYAVNEVAAEFGYSADVIAEGAVILSKAGLSIEEVNQSLEAMTMLAKANAMTFEQSAEITVFAVESFGYSYSQVPMLLDKIQVAAQSSILDVNDLQKAFAYAGSTADMTGIEFDQLISIMAVLSNRALEAGISARSVNKMFLDILDSIPQMQQWADSMGFAFDIVKDGALNIDEIVYNFGEMGVSIEMLEQSTDIFTVRALRAWGLLLGASEDYFDMLTTVNNSSGVLAEQTAVMMTSFTAQFARLKEEILALLRTEEAMEAVANMVDALVEALGKLGPDFAQAIILATEGFTEAIQGGLLDDLGMLVEMLFKLFPALTVVMRTLMKGGGIILQLVAAMTLLRLAAGGVLTGFLMLGVQYREANIGVDTLIHSKRKLGQQIMITKAQLKGEKDEWVAYGLQLHLASLRKQRMALDTDILIQKLRAAQFVITGVTQAIGMGISIGAMWAMTTNDMMKAAMALTAVLQIANIVLGLYVALEGSKSFGPLALGYIAVFLIALAAAYKGFKEEMESMEVADTGMFVGNRRTYDEGGTIGPRHQLVYVEPGEQIISKTQGMTGMGGGVNVYVGDVYAQDGTDFADKLAEALPAALRRSSTLGGF